MTLRICRFRNLPAALLVVLAACSSEELAPLPDRTTHLVIQGVLINDLDVPIPSSTVEAAVSPVFDSECPFFSRAPIVAETNAAGRFGFDLLGGPFEQAVCVTVTAHPPPPWQPADTALSNLVLHSRQTGIDTVHLVLRVSRTGDGSGAQTRDRDRS
jgi:hypothetical protein